MSNGRQDYTITVVLFSQFLIIFILPVDETRFDRMIWIMWSNHRHTVYAIRTMGYGNGLINQPLNSLSCLSLSLISKWGHVFMVTWMFQRSYLVIAYHWRRQTYKLLFHVDRRDRIPMLTAFSFTNATHLSVVTRNVYGFQMYINIVGLKCTIYRMLFTVGRFTKQELEEEH